MDKLENNNKGKCPICGIYGKLTMHGSCPKCMTALIYDNYDRQEFNELDNDFWGDTDYTI